MEGDRDMYRQFQDWCLRTYGDSGKTKTVTRKKYDRIVQLLNGSESSSTDNAKFKFWVKSKGFQLGVPDISGEEKQVLYVPVKTTDSVGMDEKLSLRQVAVVEDFFDIIYSMHVENGANGEKTRKHAGQKRTYKAISETYAFLPREAVTRFLMSCSECQKRMHLNADGPEHKENGKAPTLVTSIIDYNMPITMAYMKHMKLQLLNAQNEEEDSSLDSDEYDMSDSTRVSAVNSDLSSTMEERMASPQTLNTQQDDDSTADSINGNDGGMYHAVPLRLNSIGKVAEQQEQPLNLSDGPLLATSRVDSHAGNGRSKHKTLGLQELRTEPRENISKSPAHSYSSYESGKTEGGGLEETSHIQAENDDLDQEQEDCDKAMEVDGAEAERLKAFSDEAVSPDKPEAVLLTAPVSTTPAAQEVLYINGNGAYSCHSYGGVGGGLLDLTEAASSGPTDLSMKKQQAPSSRPQLNPSEVNAVRQLIAGYRESAAFLLRSADELENILLQQN